MAIVHDATTTVQFDAALRTAATKARTRYAGEHARISRALLLALNGAVTLHADGTASVQSGTDAEIVYTVNGHCDCPDAARAPEGRCKHRWAKALVKAALKTIAAAMTQTYFATYTTPWGEERQGIATYDETKRLTLFVPDCGAEPLYPAPAALCLGGRVDIAEAQRAVDGNLIDNIYHHNGMVTR